MRGLSLVAASGDHSSSRCAGLSLSRPLLSRSTSSRRAGSVVVAHRLSCSVACGIFPDQGSNPCLLHWQADSQPLCHQESPSSGTLKWVKLRNIRTELLWLSWGSSSHVLGLLPFYHSGTITIAHPSPSPAPWDDTP